MSHTKVPGGQEPSDKFLKRDAAAKGLGAENAPAHSEAAIPGAAPVASDSGLPGPDGRIEEALETKATWKPVNEPGTKGLGSAVPGGAAKGPNLAGP